VVLAVPPILLDRALQGRRQALVQLRPVCGEEGVSDEAISPEDRAKRARQEVFRTMFWHKKTYGHETQALADGWRCWGCDAKQTAPAPNGEGAKP
jgi:hypothetical protein